MATGMEVATLDKMSNTGAKPDSHSIGTPPSRRAKREVGEVSEFLASPTSFRPGWTYQSHFRADAKNSNGEIRFVVPWDGIGDEEKRIYEEFAKMRKFLVPEF